MEYEVYLSNHAKKYIKKLKDKSLKIKIIDAIYDDIAKEPYRYNAKVGDLSGYYTYSLNYHGTAYRIAYSIENNKLIIVILVGSHERFYEELKRLIN